MGTYLHHYASDCPEILTRFRENYALSNDYTLGSESCEILEHLEQFRTFRTLIIS